MYRLAHTDLLEDETLKVVRTPIDELGRMQQQRGLFTWIRSETHFDLGSLLDDTGRGDLLTLAEVSSDVIPEALRDLDLHGIDHRQLFPDMYGAAAFANVQLELEQLLEPSQDRPQTLTPPGADRGSARLPPDGGDGEDQQGDRGGQGHQENRQRRADDQAVARTRLDGPAW